MVKYRVVTSEKGKYIAQVFQLDIYLGLEYWKTISSSDTLEAAKDGIKKHKNAGRIVWEE